MPELQADDESGDESEVEAEAPDRCFKEVRGEQWKGHDKKVRKRIGCPLDFAGWTEKGDNYCSGVTKTRRNWAVLDVSYFKYLQTVDFDESIPPVWFCDISEGVQNGACGTDPACFKKNSTVFAYHLKKTLDIKDMSKQVNTQGFVFSPPEIVLLEKSNAIRGYVWAFGQVNFSEEQMMLQGQPACMNLTGISKNKVKILCGEAVHLAAMSSVVVPLCLDPTSPWMREGEVDGLNLQQGAIAEVHAAGVDGATGMASTGSGYVDGHAGAGEDADFAEEVTVDWYGPGLSSVPVVKEEATADVPLADQEQANDSSESPECDKVEGQERVKLEDGKVKLEDGKVKLEDGKVKLEDAPCDILESDEESDVGHRSDPKAQSSKLEITKVLGGESENPEAFDWAPAIPDYAAAVVFFSVCHSPLLSESSDSD